MPIDWDKLPDEIKHHPSVLHSRITRLEHRDQEREHHNVIGAFMRHEVKTPVGSLPLPIAIFVGSALLYWKPEALFFLFGQ